MKRSVLLSLSAVFLLTALLLISCGGGDGGTSAPAQSGTASVAVETTEAPATVDPRTVCDLPEKADLGGYEFRVFKQVSDKIAWSWNIFAPEEQTGEVLNDLFFKRNINVSEQYNCSVKEIVQDSDPLSKSLANITAGDDFCDVTFTVISNYSKALDGSFWNVYDLPNVSLDKLYWDQNIQRDLTLRGNLYAITGDIIVTENECMMMTMYHRALADDLKMENLYDTVRAGKWTFDKMYTLAEQAASDLDGDGVIDIEKDRIGLLFVNNSAAEPYFAASGSRVFRIVDDVPTLQANAESAYAVFEKMNKLLGNRKLSYDWSVLNPNTPAHIADLIEKKNVLFQNMVVNFVRRSFRDVTHDIGLLPIPKLTEEQEIYATNINLSCPHIFVPISVKDPEKCGFILEALSAASAEITDTYYTVCMQSKYTRDKESYEMIDLAKRNLVYDPGFIFNWGSLGSSIRSAIMTADSGYASLLAEKSDAAVAAAKEFVEKLK